MKLDRLLALLSGLAAFACARTFRERRGAASVVLVMRLTVIAALAVLLMGPSRVAPYHERSLATD